MKRVAGCFRFALTALSALLLLAGAAMGQTGELTEPPEVKPEALQSRIRRIEEAADLQPEVKDELLKEYRAALESAQQVRQARSEAEDFEQQASAAPERLQQLKSEIDQPEQPVEEPPGGLALDELRERLAAKEAELKAARDRLEELKRERQQRAERRRQLPAEQGKWQSELQDLRQKLAGPLAEDPVLAAARRSRALARRDALEAKLDRSDEELASYEARSGLLEARIKHAEQRVERARKVVERWQQAVERRATQEAEAAARKVAAEAAEVPPALKETARENRQLADLRVRVTEEGHEAGRKLAQIVEQEKSLSEELAKARSRVEEDGLTRAMGSYLRRKRGEMPEVSGHLRKFRSRQQELAEARVKLFELRQQLQGLQDLDAGVDRAMERLGNGLNEQQRQRLRRTVRDLLTTRRETLEKLASEYEEVYTSNLAQLNTAELQLVETIREYREFIDTNILWFRSSTGLSTKSLPQMAEAGAWLAAPGNWHRLGGGLLADARRLPLVYALALLAVAALLVFRRRVRAGLLSSGRKVVRMESDSFLYTLAALALSALLAAPIPLLLAFVGWRLVSALQGTDFTTALGHGLQAAAIAYLTIDLLRVVCTEEGLFDRHFRWRTRPLLEFRRNLTWLLPVLIPVVFLAASLRAQPNQLWAESLGRISLMVALVVAAVFILRVLRFRGGILQETLENKSEGWLNRLRWFWYLGAALVPVALAVAVGAGWYYTGVVLSIRMVDTVWLLLAVVVVYELLLRWLFIQRRQLALEKARQRREAQEAEREEGAERPAEEGGEVQVEEPEVSLYTSSAQTLQLLRSLYWFAVLLVLWGVWNNVLPALSVLKEVELESDLPITLAGVGLAIVVTAVTVLAAKNIPGLLEIAALQHLPLEAGVRFAISTICRYVIVVIGIIAAAGALGIGWQHVQWLAAAVGVGLGFGLQEIFANFVSGLIILFERPMRVGDIVTVGDVTGTVSRIRIRATTIVDWDRKELVVPNREFITGRLINWTLSDRILRVIVPVGIAYGSDTELAVETLLEVARGNANALEEPEPSVLFMGFGESTLNFELRVFVPNVELRLKVRHELTMAVDRAFREKGIEIAFPQQDLHVRSIEDALTVRRKPESPQDSEESAE
ncbi:MAG: mechanosensitive ion channel domain-containing protein [Planctomycetota bacterium]